MGFVQTMSRTSRKEEKEITKGVRKQLSDLNKRKKALIKSGQFTSDKRSYFKEMEADLKRALR